MTQRVRVLKLLADQKYAILEDLYIGSGSTGSKESFRVSLYQFGLSRFSFPAVVGGVWHIANPQIYQELEQVFPKEPLYKSTDIHFNEIYHALGMNKIRHSLLNGGKLSIKSWYSEYSLRAMPISVRGFSYTKIPDAIFFRSLEDGKQQKCFVEYERSLKNRERYRNIFKFYANRKDVSRGSVLFICQNKYIQNELLKIRKEVFSKGIFNDVEEIFKIINLDAVIASMEEGSVNEQSNGDGSIQLVVNDVR